MQCGRQMIFAGTGTNGSEWRPGSCEYVGPLTNGYAVASLEFTGRSTDDKAFPVPTSRRGDGTVKSLQPDAGGS